MARRAGLVLALSIAAHAGAIGGLVAGAGERAAPAPVPVARSIAGGVRARFAAVQRPMELREERAALVRKALQERSEGRLELGAFLLEASRIDAEESGIELDVGLARARYEQRVAELRAALAEGDVAHAVPAVMGDLKYYGRPGGLMASALAEGGGSCEQISQVVAAAVHDAGRPREIALRYYGGVMEDGAAHLTPIALEKKGERDLMTGQPAAPGGVRLDAEALVDVYARAHGLEPPLPGSAKERGKNATNAASSAGSGAAAAGEKGGSGASASVAAGDDAGRDGARRPTLVAGMPPNGDRFPGSLPLYAEHAIARPEQAAERGAEGEGMGLEAQAKLCPFYVRLGTLSPPSVDVELPASEAHAGGFMEAEPRRAPGPAMLEREAFLMRAAETVARRSATAPTDRLIGWACLAALGEIAAVDFELAGEHAVAIESVRVHQLGRDEGAKALAAIDWAANDGAAARKLLSDYGGQGWILLALPGGERVVMDLASRARRELDGWLGLHAALVVWPATRARAVSSVAASPLPHQIEVMQAIFQTSDRARYFAGTLDLDGTPADGPASARFLATYRVFRRLASRLWDGAEPDETLAALERDARAASLDAESEAALIEYYARHTLSLYSQRIELSGEIPLDSVTGRSRQIVFSANRPRNAREAGPHAWQRPGGMELVRSLRATLERHPQPSLDPLRRCLAYIEAQGHLDPTTLADGLRLN
jgi:hypothetical protein